MKPFQGIIFCTTGFSDESCLRKIGKKIVKLGGVFNVDLTLQVNVLIIGSKRDTEKYKFAVRHCPEMIFISMNAIEMIYQQWLAGEDLNNAFDLLKSRFFLPPLEGIYVFIGRVNDKNCSLQELERLCHLQGCFKCYSTHFSKDCHTNGQGTLVVFLTDSLDGSRVEAAMGMNIPIIHPKWVLDCYKRNALLEFEPYYLLKNIEPRTPFDQIGIGSCECWSSLTEKSNSFKDSSSNNPIARVNQPRIKFKPQGDRLWKKVMSNEHQSLSLPSSLTSFSVNTELPKEERTHSTVHHIFQDVTFNIDPRFREDHVTILQRVIEQHAGILTNDSAQYNIIPSDCPLEESINFHAVLVTEFFIERCLHYKKLIDPPDSWCKPFLESFDVRLKPSNSLLHDNRSQFLKVAITGFRGVELLHLTKLLKIMAPMGITFTEYLNDSTDLLLINLSSLPSIPTSHPLWNNKYSDLFHLEAQQIKDVTSPNQVFRNSMKHKLEFVKHKHSIPVVTPAFLFSLLNHSSGLHSSEKSTVYINNINWCIICPRGSRENFSIDILPKKLSLPPCFFREASSSETSIKNSGLELLNKLNQSSCPKAKSIPSKRLDHEENFRENKPKHRHIGRKNGDRTTSSWGKLMSEELNNSSEQDPFDLEQTKPSPKNSDVNFTQITYGTSSSDVNQHRVRKLTRKQVKELGS